MKILVAGSSNIDLFGIGEKRLVIYGDNKGSVLKRDGGTARNIAADSAKLGLPVTLLTALGEDEDGKRLLANLADLGVNTLPSTRLAGQTTPTNIKLIDSDKVLINSIYTEPLSKQLHVHYVKKVTVEQYDILLADTSLADDVLRYFTNFVQVRERILVPAFGEEMQSLTEMMWAFDTLIIHADNAEMLSGMFVRTVEEAKECARNILSQGFRNVFIIMDERGVVAADKENALHIPAFKTEQDASRSALDSFAAGIIYASASRLPIFQKALFASACYAQASRSEFGEEAFSLDAVGNVLLHGERNKEFMDEE